jgi:hypothetical protein
VLCSRESTHGRVAWVTHGHRGGTAGEEERASSRGHKRGAAAATEGKGGG